MSQLQEILSSVNGNTILSIDTATEPTLLGGKRNTMKGRVRKVMTGANVMVFTNKKVNGYFAMIHRRLVAEGKDPESFVLGPRKWGERIEGTPFVQHNGELYLEVIFLRPGRVHYELDGTVIDEDQVEGLQKRADDPDSQGGLDNKVVIRTFKASSIVAMTVNGQRHVL